jgi:hemerythrin-like domain-containing protein
MIIDVLRHEHHNIEMLLLVLEQELNVFDRGERPDYEVIWAVIAYFQVYPAAFHHPQEDLVFQKLKARDPAEAAKIGDLAAEHRRGAEHLRRVALAVENVLMDQEIPRHVVDGIIRDFIMYERRPYRHGRARFLSGRGQNPPTRGLGGARLVEIDWSEGSSFQRDRRREV